MTLRQLDVFLAVAREGSFSRAAKKIRLSQPTMSEHVRELERELGKPLFLRRGRAVTLTEAGRVFEAYAARVGADVAGARQAVAELDGLGHGSLQVGASTTSGLYVMPAVVAAFRARYPGVDPTLQIANSQVIEERVRERELDLGVVGGHTVGPGEECLAAGLLDVLVLVVAPGHPWARRREIAPTRLAAQPLLMREEGSATRRVTERALQRAGITFHAAMELNHTEAIKQAVMAGLGVALVSTHAVRGEVETGRLRALRLRNLRIRRHFHVIHHQNRMLSASARAFLQLLEAMGQGPRRPLPGTKRRGRRGARSRSSVPRR